MADTKVIMPQMGESIFEGTLTKWLKKPGDKVERDEALFEISTDKIDSEIPSPAAGILQEVLVKEGQTVQINTVVAVIGDGSAKPAPTEETEACARLLKKSRRQHPSLETSDSGRSSRGTGRERTRHRRWFEILARNMASTWRRLAGKGSGINGRVTKEDILAAVEKAGATRRCDKPALLAPAGDREVFRRRGTRADDRDAEVDRRTHDGEPRHIAQVTTFFEVECSRIVSGARKAEGGVRTRGRASDHHSLSLCRPLSGRCRSSRS
jgi:pyruvate/2-oxoglutarate dehydrogenase complex dihydrolipoamide acyltransferase (E2) component